MLKLFCPKDGTVHEAMLEGYEFGDRLLEGVLFSVELKDGKLVTSGPRLRSDKEYFSTLNEKMWLDSANKYLADIQEEGEALQCPVCYDHTVTVVDDEVDDSTSKKVKLFKGKKKVLLSDFESTLGKDINGFIAALEIEYDREEDRLV